MSDYGDDDDDFGDIDDEALAQLATQVEQQQSSLSAISLPGGEPSSSGPSRSCLAARPSAAANYQQYNLFGEPIAESQLGSQVASQRSTPRRIESPTHHQLDLEAVKTWKYPTNVELRDYQFNIVSKALLNNILVALPTGLSPSAGRGAQLLSRVDSRSRKDLYRCRGHAQLVPMGAKEPDCLPCTNETSGSAANRGMHQSRWNTAG